MPFSRRRRGCKYVAELNQHQITAVILCGGLGPLPWGSYDIIDEGDNFKIKRIQVNPGASLSLQKHTKRVERWEAVKGVAELICGNKKITLKENESTYIPLSNRHQF